VLEFLCVCGGSYSVASVDLRAWFYHTIQGLHVSVIKRKLMMNSFIIINDEFINGVAAGQDAPLGARVALRLPPRDSGPETRATGAPNPHTLHLRGTGVPRS